MFAPVTPIVGEPPVVLLCRPEQNLVHIAIVGPAHREGDHAGEGFGGDGDPRIRVWNNDYGIKPASVFCGRSAIPGRYVVEHVIENCVPGVVDTDKKKKQVRMCLSP
jgi:hypothetical protein